MNCQQDAFLRLIRSMKPNVLVHGISSGYYNAPFFITRFHEALFKLSICMICLMLPLLVMMNRGQCWRGNFMGERL